MQCYRCSAPKSANAVAVTANLTSDPYADVAIVSATPSSTLAVRGIPLYSTEEQVAETFRQFAPVKNVFLVRDLASRMSRGIAFVEYHSTDYATHALNNSQHLQMDRTTLKVNYAKEAFIQSIPAHQQQQRMMMMVQQSQYPGAGVGNTMQQYQTPAARSDTSMYAAAALQAAQWSSSSASASTSVAPQSGVSTDVSTTAYTPRVKSHWPLNFESNGAAYVFQPQTGVFYDSIQKYYYCPKSKLYYSETDGKYLRAAAAGSDPPYVEFDPPAPSHQPSEETSTMMVGVHFHTAYS